MGLGFRVRGVGFRGLGFRVRGLGSILGSFLCPPFFWKLPYAPYSATLLDHPERNSKPPKPDAGARSDKLPRRSACGVRQGS